MQKALIINNSEEKKAENWTQLQAINKTQNH